MPKIRYELKIENVDLVNILNKYYDDDIEEETMLYNDDINISDILHEKGKISKQSDVFINFYKTKIKCWINMYDFSKNMCLPLHVNKPCWYCRNTFQNSPIGCPIKYHGRDTPSHIKKEIIKSMKEENLKVDDNNFSFFETEGIFCSFSCTKSYIFDELAKTNSPLYKNSSNLLNLLYYKITNRIDKIPLSHSWKTLKDYCGHLTIEEFRNSCGIISYDETVNYKRSYMYPLSLKIKENRLKV